MDTAELLEIVRRDLDPTTLAIVEAKLADAGRLSIIRDAFMEGKDALAVKMIRDLDPCRDVEMLPLSAVFYQGLQPGEVTQITARPQRCPFRPRQLWIARDVASRIAIHDIKIGNRSQFAQSGDVPGDVFAVDMPVIEPEYVPNEDDPNRPLTKLVELRVRGSDRMLTFHAEECQTAMDLVVVIANISDTPIHRFGAVILGATKNGW